MSYITDKCLERMYKNEDTLVHTKDDIIIGIDEDDTGKHLIIKDGQNPRAKIYLIDDNFMIDLLDKDEQKHMTKEFVLALANAIRYLVNAVESTKDEDGTAADLGAIPTGHYTHSVDCHDEDEDDDGW